MQLLQFIIYLEHWKETADTPLGKLKKAEQNFHGELILVKNEQSNSSKTI